jgi:hypothetical protein
MRQHAFLTAILLSLTFAGCASRQTAGFSEQNAAAHVAMLAGTIGSRPVGSPENARARGYIVDQLRSFGFEVRVQETDARVPGAGLTAHVANIIAIRAGARREAVGLVSHYDSVADAPGAGDDAFGVSVSLEAARLLAARTNPNWSLMVLVTDGEEAGLMGAAALMDDREVAERLNAYLNLEAVGSRGTATLFETGPGNGWLVGRWSKFSPFPRGDSFGTEIYKRLPNDTDFSIFKQYGIPGLNFAITGDSYAYHTARDTPQRLSSQSLRESGENIVATVGALDAVDITQRSGANSTYFDIAQRSAVSYGPVADRLISLAALLLGVIAWVRMSSAAIAIRGVAWWLFTALWAALGGAFAIAAMVAATWALRAAREVYHPWYAMPDRLFLFMVLTGVTIGWAVVRVGAFLPDRAHGLRNPVVTWSAALPAWILLGAAAFWYAPGAAYLWTTPLLIAGFLLTITPARSAVAVRIASLLILLATAVLWLMDSLEVLRFVVAVFGRLPIVTPVFVYAAIAAVAGIMLVPPFIAVTARSRPLVRPKLMTAVLLLAVSAAAASAYVAPAYTHEQPLRRYVRAIQIGAEDSATWEVASTEPGLDLSDGAPTGWSQADGPVEGIPWGALPHRFVFRKTGGPSLGAPPMTITTFIAQPLEAGVELQLTVVPRQPGLSVTFLLPAGLKPARSNLPGDIRRGRWAATYVAVPEEGVSLRASFAKVPAEALQQTECVVISERFPQGSGWQSLPAWLPQERTVWAARASWVLRLPGWAGIAPVPSLR